MPDSKGLMDDAADGLKSVLGRLGEFFHIFDLSFFVAGAVSFAAICFLFIKLGLVGTFPFAPWVAGLSLVLACYVCGLICFSLGRPVNRFLFRRGVLSGLLRRSMEVHKLTYPGMSTYLESGDKELWRLYIRLWQQLAAKHARSVSFTHLSRYWAMADIYDSLAVALLLWAAVLVVVVVIGAPPPSGRQSLAAIVLLVGAAVAAFNQGGKYYEFQVEDLVAALAVAEESVDEGRKSG